MYWYLSSFGPNVEINDDLAGGGPDFTCACKHGEFLVEVSSLSISSATKESGISNEFHRGEQSFRPISRQLFEKAISKVSQLTGLGKPVVLAITTEHSHGAVLVNLATARQLLTGQSHLVFIHNASESRTWVETTLKDSVFYNTGCDDPVDHCRRDISGIVLAYIACNSMRVSVVMNPGQTYVLNHELLPSVPFLQVSHETNRGNLVFGIERRTLEDSEYMQFSTENP